MVEKLQNSLRDIVERAASTAAQAAVGVIIATQATDTIDLSWLLVVVATSACAFLIVVKGSVASQFGDRTASLMTQYAIARDERGRFVSRRVSFESEDIKKNGD